MTTEDAFWDALRNDPADDTAKLVFSDWCEENGRPSLAHALRWCVLWRRWPREVARRMRISDGKVLSLDRWLWSSSSWNGPTRQRSNSLPPLVYRQVQVAYRERSVGGLTAIGAQRTLELVIGDLADAFDEIRRHLEVNPTAVLAKSDSEG